MNSLRHRTLSSRFGMELLFILIASNCFILMEVNGQSQPDLSTGIAELRSLLGLNDTISLVPIVSSSNVVVPGRKFQSVSENIVVRFELRAHSVPVYDAVVTAEFFPNGTFAVLWTSHGADIIVRDNGKPLLLPLTALTKLVRKYGSIVLLLQALQNDDVSLFYVMDPVTKVARLVYRASFVHYGQEIISLGNQARATAKPTALIDAKTGEVIQFWDDLASQHVSTKEIRAFGGNLGDVLGRLAYWDLEVGIQANGQCIYSTDDVQVQSMGSTTDGPFSPTSFACAAPQKETYDNANDGLSPLNDAMINAQTTVKMFRMYVNGLDQPHFDMPVKLRVHYGTASSCAFWDGTYANFGDGSNTTFPLVTLDIIAHELAHAFTGYRNSSRLETVGEPGGINEAFSDMSGQAALFYSRRMATMMPGVEYTKTGDPVRNMCDPPSDGISIDNYTQYTNDMDPHYSSGLYNKVFCILSRLGVYWHVGTVFQVFAFANRLLWRPKTTFNEGVCGVQVAASHLLGSGAIDDVRRAFNQVGLACPN